MPRLCLWLLLAWLAGACADGTESGNPSSPTDAGAVVDGSSGKGGSAGSGGGHAGSSGKGGSGGTGGTGGTADLDGGEEEDAGCAE